MMPKTGYYCCCALVFIAICFAPQRECTRDKVSSVRVNFPKAFRVREKKTIVWRMFQHFEVENTAERSIAEFRESPSSWLHELFGGAYVTLYDADGRIDSTFSFAMMQRYLLFGGRLAKSFEYSGNCIFHGQQQSFFSAMWTGKRRPLILHLPDGMQLVSQKTQLVQDAQEWEVRADDGTRLCKMEEFVIEDVWHQRYRGWEVEIFNHSAMDPRIPAQLAAVDLGARVLKERLKEQNGKTTLGSPFEATSNQKGTLLQSFLQALMLVGLVIVAATAIHHFKSMEARIDAMNQELADLKHSIILQRPPQQEQE